MAQHSPRDWHPADVMAALRKTEERWTLRSLSLASGYSESSVGKALRAPWPAVEQIIADELGLHPKEIWPSRYTRDGKPKLVRAPRKLPTPTRGGQTGRTTANHREAA